MKSHAFRRLRRSVPLAGIALLVACNQAPVAWSEPTPAPPAPGRVAIDADGRTRVVPLHGPTPTVPGGAAGCEASYRFSWLDSAQVYAVWWVPRPDRSAALFASYSGDAGRSWTPPAPVDSTDVSAAGCDRPAPAVAGDGSTVHVVYSLTSSEGTGIFFAHSMDFATLFHSPVPVVYGNRLGAADVAAHGDTVVVAYENLDAPSRIGLAISRTMGHIFEQRVPASTGIGIATSPQVAVAGPTVAVSWLQRAAADSTRTVRMLRIGRLQ